MSGEVFKGSIGTYVRQALSSVMSGQVQSAPTKGKPADFDNTIFTCGPRPLPWSDNLVNVPHPSLPLPHTHQAATSQRSALCTGRTQRLLKLAPGRSAPAGSASDPPPQQQSLPRTRSFQCAALWLVHTTADQSSPSNSDVIKVIRPHMSGAVRDRDAFRQADAAVWAVRCRYGGDKVSQRDIQRLLSFEKVVKKSLDKAESEVEEA